jgi:hypothetical protein
MSQTPTTEPYYNLSQDQRDTLSDLLDTFEDDDEEGDYDDD